MSNPHKWLALQAKSYSDALSPPNNATAALAAHNPTYATSQYPKTNWVRSPPHYISISPLSITWPSRSGWNKSRALLWINLPLWANMADPSRMAAPNVKPNNTLSTTNIPTGQLESRPNQRPLVIPRLDAEITTRCCHRRWTGLERPWTE